MHEAESFDEAHDKPPRQNGNFWKYLSIFLMVVVVGGGFFIFASSFSGGMGAATALVRDTFGDVLGSGNERKLAAEIDLRSVPEASGIPNGSSGAKNSYTENVASGEMPS